MPDANSERFEPQDLGKDTAPRGSSSGADPLISPFGPKNPQLQGGNTPKKPPQQQNRHELATDAKKLPQVYIDELQRTHTDELQHTHTDDLKEEKNPRSSNRQKKVENPQISDFTDHKDHIEDFKRGNSKSSLDEEERHKSFERNLNKLALFAYEAEEGAEMLASGQNPFLEEVDKMLQEIDSSTGSLPEDLDRLLQEISSGTKPLPEDLDRLLQEIGSGTEPLLEKGNEGLEQREQQQKDPGYSEQPEQRKKQKDPGYLD